MTSKNSVRVTVNLIDNFSDTLKKLDEKLDAISRKVLTPHLEMTGTGEIDNVKLKLESLDEIIEVLLNIMGEQKLNRTKAKVESLSGVENVKVKVHDGELVRAMAKKHALRQELLAPIARNEMLRFDRRFKDSGFMGGVSGMDFKQIAQDMRIRQDHARALQEHTKSTKRRMARHAGAPWLTTPLSGRGGDRKRRGNAGGLLGRFSAVIGGVMGGLLSTGGGDGGISPGMFIGGDGEKRNNPFATVGKGILSKVIPRGQFTQDLVAFFMPIMTSLYAAIGGMIAAFGATAVAGLSVGLLGLIGFGENAADSLKLAEVRMRLFGRELFKVFKPVTQTFAPVMDSFFKRAPHALSRLTRPLQSLTQYVPALNRHGNGIIDWTGALINKTVELQPQITQLTSRFGQLTGQKTIEFFQWLVEELYRNQDALLRVMSVAKSFIYFMYRIFLLWSVLIGVLKPLADLLSRVADILVNKWVVGIVATIAVALTLLAVLWSLGGALMFITSVGIAAAFTSMLGPIGAATVSMYGYAAATLAAAKAGSLLAIAATGGVAALSIGAGWLALNAAADISGDGGPGSASNTRGSPIGGTFGGGGSGGSGSTTIIQIQGDVGKREYNQIRDDFPGLYHEQQQYDSSTTRPSL